MQFLTTQEFALDIKIERAAELGSIAYSARKESHLRIDDFAAMVRVSKNFASALEHGKPTLQIDRALKSSTT